MEQFINFYTICTALVLLSLLFTVIGLVTIRKVTKKTKADVLYWKQQWETANNVSKEMQKVLDKHNESIVVVTDTYDAEINKLGKIKKYRTPNQIKYDAVIKLSNEIVNSGCLEIKAHPLGKMYDVKLTMVKPTN